MKSLSAGWRAFCGGAIAIACISAAHAQIAITEFLNNPDGDDEIREFIELFNYSLEPVNIAGWELSDEDNDFIILSETDLVIPSGGYLVFSSDKALMEADRFGGEPQPGIIDYDATSSGFVMSNSSDEIILLDDEGEIVWAIAYDNDDNSGRATFLTEDDFSTRIWGSKEAPGINRDGEDLATGTLGYESNRSTDDPDATETDNEDVASPLAGFYTTREIQVTAADPSIRSIVPGTDPGSFDITFKSETGFSYTIESSGELMVFTPDFTEEGTGALMTVTVTPDDTATRRFYRVRLAGQ